VRGGHGGNRSADGFFLFAAFSNVQTTPWFKKSQFDKAANHKTAEVKRHPAFSSPVPLCTGNGETTFSAARFPSVDRRHFRKEKRAYIKKKRKTKLYDKLRENAEKLIKENKKNLRYGSGITGPFREDTVRPTKARRESATQLKDWTRRQS
jgi:hypothetical protein